MQNVIFDDDLRIPIKSWADEIENSALSQARDLAILPFLYKWVALMPDCHAGYGMPIGGVVAASNVVSPNLVGVDIGCGVIAVKTSLEQINTETIKKIMGKIRETIPVGFNHNKQPQPWDGFNLAPDIPIIQQELTSSRKQLGTLGGGNHFIEIQKGNDGYIWLMIHSGSRNFGLKTANEYNKKAIDLCKRWYVELPNKDLAFFPIEEKEGKEYMIAMKYCLNFAQANRSLMMEKLFDIFKTEVNAEILDEINIHHNYAAWENHFGRNVIVHRKGATKATLELKGIIPGSMGSNSYITEGLGNQDSFASCSHGAGRRMGRGEATRTLNLEEEQKKMEGIVHGLRTNADLDESPGSYKSIDEVMKNQMDLTKILVKLTPLANIKG